MFDDHRLLPVGMVSMLDIDGAIDDAKAVAEQGFRALFLPAQVPSRLYNDGAYDPFWAVAEELGLPLTFHSGHRPRAARRARPGRRGRSTTSWARSSTARW